MLEWLKEILGEAYTDDIDKSVSGKIGENFVAKADFNKKLEDIKTKDSQISDLNNPIKDRDKQLDKLKEVDPEELKNEIETLKTTNKTTAAEYEAKIAKIKLDNAVDSFLTSSGSKDNLSVRAHLADFLKEAKVGDDGNVLGLEEKVNGLKESAAFLLKRKRQLHREPQARHQEQANPGPVHQQRARNPRK